VELCVGCEASFSLADGCVQPACSPRSNMTPLQDAVCAARAQNDN